MSDKSFDEIIKKYVDDIVSSMLSDTTNNVDMLETRIQRAEEQITPMNMLDVRVNRLEASWTPLGTIVTDTKKDLENSIISIKDRFEKIESRIHTLDKSVKRENQELEKRCKEFVVYGLILSLVIAGLLFSSIKNSFNIHNMTESFETEETP